MSPPSWIEKKFLPLNYRQMTGLCNWCHMPYVAKTKGKCAISTLIFWKFSGGYAPRPPYWGGGRGYGAPPQTPPPSALRHSTPRSGPSVRPSSCPPLTKILATRLPTVMKICTDRTCQCGKEKETSYQSVMSYWGEGQSLDLYILSFPSVDAFPGCYKDTPSLDLTYWRLSS